MPTRRLVRLMTVRALLPLAGATRPDGNRAMTLTTVNGDVDARRD